MRSFGQYFLLYSTLCVAGVVGRPFDSNTTRSFDRSALVNTPEREPQAATGRLRLDRRQGRVGAIGLGDDSDFTYTVSLQLGSVTTAVNLDTGSSDLWAISTSCTSSTCQDAKAPAYSVATFQPAQNNPGVKLLYGDSTTGTFATGPIGSDTVVLAGVETDSQIFVAANDTNNVSVQNGAAGILGVGFPTESFIQAQAVAAVSSSQGTDAFFSAISSEGPLLARMAASGVIEQPMFTIMLQRDTIDASVTQGQFTIGTLPDGVDNSSLTWVPVRLYSVSDGGTAPPSFASDEASIYPLRWEVPLDAVFLDGNQLGNSNISSITTEVSALIDTGNSILRGPEDVVQSIYSSISTSFSPEHPNSRAIYPCNRLHTLAFQFGGKQFPVDPRDFLSPVSSILGGLPECDAAGNLVSTDPPSSGSLLSWSLGDTFMKSNLVAFYFGNLTHPSVDPPRIGFMSMVPSDADQDAAKDVQTAEANGHFFTTTNAAPTAAISLASQPSSATSGISTPAQSTNNRPNVNPDTNVNTKSQPNGALAQVTRSPSNIALVALTMVTAYLALVESVP